MPDEPGRTQHHLVVLDEDNRVLIVSAAGARRLPAADLEVWADPAELAQAAGDPEAVPCAPPREVFVGGTRHLIYVLRGGGRTGLPASQWDSLPDRGASDDLDEPDCVREVVARVVAEQTGNLPMPAQRPPWWQPGWQSDIDAWIDEQLAAVGRVRSDSGSVRGLPRSLARAVSRSPDRACDGVGGGGELELAP